MQSEIGRPEAEDLDAFGWRHSRLLFLRKFLAGGFFLSMFSWLLGGSPLLMCALGILLVSAVSVVPMAGLLGLQLAGAILLTRTGYLFHSAPLASDAGEQISHLAHSILGIALTVELMISCIALLSLPNNEARAARHPSLIGFFRGLFGAPHGFAMATGFRLTHTFVYAGIVTLQLYLAWRLIEFILLSSKPSPSGFAELALVAIGIIALTSLIRILPYASASSMRKKDSRPPVLVLRSFSDDRISAASSSKLVFDRILSDPIPPRNVDELLFLEASNYGPLIAIGDPQRPTHEFGVYRDFVDESEWKDYIVNFCSRARFTIIVPDKTPGVEWELGLFGRQRGLLKDLLILAPFKYRTPTQNQEFWIWVGRAIGSSEIASQSSLLSKPCLGVYFDRRRPKFLVSNHFRLDGYSAGLKFFLANKEYPRDVASFLGPEVASGRGLAALDERWLRERDLITLDWLQNNILEFNDTVDLKEIRNDPKLLRSWTMMRDMWPQKRQLS